MAEIHIEEGISEVSLKTIDDLLAVVREYQPEESLAFIKNAYYFSERAHSGQIRRSGEPYINHPLNVAGILAFLRLDMETIATGLLHDTVEDTEVTLEDIKKEFGESTANLVDGVTKISQISFRNTHEKQGENIRKMIIAMGKDVRVILVKLADRLHNMRTLNHMPYSKQARIAQETLDIYAPLASRLGISSLKVELEDLSFRYSRPEMFYSLVQKVAKKKKERERYIDEVKRLLATEMQKVKFSCEIQGRPKHLYSIFRKMEYRNIDYEQVYDVLAFRVLVNTVPECYEVLGLVHSLWKPIPGRFKDFIAMPKANNYRSLHTTVTGPGGERIEIQIRTEEMHLIAERGIAAHWQYKEGGNVDKETVAHFEWLKELVSWHQQVGNSNEFLETVKTDLFESEIYVFTPRGDVKAFPDGATPIDFAYSVHTDVGNRCVAARINGRLVPLKYKLKSGDRVEVVTSKNQTPSKDWLKHCVTNRAKSKIRAHVKNEQRKRALELGRELVDREFRRHGLGYMKYLKGTQFEEYLKNVGAHDADELIVRVGYGKIEPRSILTALAPEKAKPEEKEEPKTFLGKVFKAASVKKKSKSIIQVDGMSDVLVHFAKCCGPIPGDPILGYITRGRGITVHCADCPKAFEMDQMRQVDVAWSEVKADQEERSARVRVISHDIPGLLKNMTESFSNRGINIHNAQIRTTRDKKAVCIFDVGVRDTQQLNDVLFDLQKIKGVLGVTRLTRF